MRRKHHPTARLAPGCKPSHEIGTALQDRLKFNIQSGFARSRGEKLPNALFPGMRMLRRQKCRIDAWQRNKFAQQFFGLAHALRWTEDAENTRRIAGVEEGKKTPSHQS
jgi:hypothetical protein